MIGCPYCLANPTTTVLALAPTTVPVARQVAAEGQPRARRCGRAAYAGRVSEVVRVPRARVALSTTSTYPESTASAFELAARLGYDGVELMVFLDPVSQEIDAVRRLSDHYGVPVLAVHAPCLLITQRVWGTDPWAKLVRSKEAAEALGASTVVVHPPFRWQREYARSFVTGVGRMSEETDVVFAVENMYPWKAASREVAAYLPDWDPTDEDYEHITLDLSHTAVSGSDALAMADEPRGPAGAPAPGRRLRVQPGRASGAGPRHPAVRPGAGAAGQDRLRRHRRAGGVHPPGGQPGRARGRPRGGAGLRAAEPRVRRPAPRSHGSGG